MTVASHRFQPVVVDSLMVIMTADESYTIETYRNLIPAKVVRILEIDQEIARLQREKEDLWKETHAMERYLMARDINAKTIDEWRNGN